MRFKPLRALAVTAAAATFITLVVDAPSAAAEDIANTGSCVDGGGRTWTAKVVWGDAYTDSAGVNKVRVDWVGWTTDAEGVETDSTVRTYDANGNQLQESRWTGWFDYNAGTSWRSRNPRNPPSAPGETKVTLTLGVGGSGFRGCQTSFVQPSSPAAAATQAAAPAPDGSGWVSNQSAVPLGNAGCTAESPTPTAVALSKEWDWWDNCGGSEVSASAEGLPAQPGGGDHVFRWRKPTGDSNVYQKLNRTLTKDNWPKGSAGQVQRTGSPADVSGVYKVSQYIPSSRFRLNPGHGWVILSEFKETFINASGNWDQPMTWGLLCSNFSGPAACSLSLGSSPTKFALAPYLDRWVTWEYRIYQGAKDTTGHGGRIELWANGKLLDTGYESQRHVGSAAFSPLAKTQAWVFVAGQYTSNQNTGGVPDYQNTDVTSYVGQSSITPIR